nr:small nuclear ribonucleoprotein G-like [Desmodus rotundus]
MSKVYPPQLKKLTDKKLSLKLNGGRHVQGILQGSDPPRNRVGTATGGQEHNAGVAVIRGGSAMSEAWEQVHRTAVFAREVNSFHTSPPHSTHSTTIQK